MANILIEIYHVLKHAVMITGFVFGMMLVIEYVNVQTRGIWKNAMAASKWKQYLFASALGAIPGCLGAFTAVTLFSHRILSFGALVAAMIATSGDEAFVMFAMFPEEAIYLTFSLFAIGILAGYITDKVYKPVKILERLAEKRLPLHEEEPCKCFQKELFLKQLLRPSPYRLLLTILILSLLTALVTGILAGDAKLWIKFTILLIAGVSLVIVVSVPEHFLRKHLWDHIVKVHLPRIFLWTFGTLLVFSLLLNLIDIQSWLSDNMLIVLFVAVLVGIIPESGPHLIFVTLFAQGTIPFSVLLASSISQDGHGMLPLLAESKRSFIAVKTTNIIYALVFGLTGYLIGF